MKQVVKTVIPVDQMTQEDVGINDFVVRVFQKQVSFLVPYQAPVGFDDSGKWAFVQPGTHNYNTASRSREEVIRRTVEDPLTNGDDYLYVFDSLHDFAEAVIKHGWTL